MFHDNAVRFLSIVCAAWCALDSAGVSAAPLDPGSAEIVLHHEKYQQHRARLADAVLLLAVEGQVLPGCDPNFAPQFRGAVTLARLPDGKEVFLTAAPVVREVRRLTIVRDERRRSEARVVRELPDQGVVVLEALDRAALGKLRALPMTEDEEATVAERTVFSLDNLASGYEVLSWGHVVGPGEPPLTELRVVGLKLFDGHPLVDAEARLLGICFRRVTPTSEYCFAGTSVEILRTLGYLEKPPGDGAAEPATLRH